MRRRTITILALSIIAAGVVLVLVMGGVFRGGVVIDAARVQLGTLEVTLPVTGIFETRAVDLAFEIPGRLTDVRVSEGAAVRRGIILAALDAPDLLAAAEQAEAAVAAARSDAVRARAAVDGARQQAAQAEAAFRAAEANLAGVRSGPSAPELRQVDAAVEAARLAMEEAKRNLAVQERLYREGAVAGVQVDAARAQAETAAAQYQQALARREAVRAGAPSATVTATAEQVRQAEAAWRTAVTNIRQAQAVAVAAGANAEQAAAALRAARARAARTQLRAPFDGVVTRVYVNAGAPVAPSLPVMSIVTEQGWVVAEVDEADIGRVQLRQRARITADAYPDRVLTGRVTRIGGQVDVNVRQGARSVRVRIELDGRWGMRSGTSVDVDLIQDTVTGTLLVPLEAIQQDNGGGSYVFVVQQGVLHRRTVQTGQRNDRFAAVRHGLQEGEFVAIGDPAALREGQRVSVRAVQ